MPKLIHTISSIRTWQKCKKKWFWQNIELLKPAKPSKALELGSAVHKFLEAVYSPLSKEESMRLMVQYCNDHFSPEWLDVETRRATAICDAYLETYGDKLISNERGDVTSIEKRLTRDFRGFTFSGKTDMTTETHTVQKYIWDHKTTSDDISNVGENYWQKMNLDNQAAVYSFLEGGSPRIVWDVIKKPGGNPKMKERIVKRKTESGEEFDQRKQDSMESLDEFQARLYQEIMNNKTGYFARNEVYMTELHVAYAMEDLLSEALAIEEASRWPKSDGACISGYGTFEYFGLCVGTESIDSGNFIKLKEAHPELSESTESTVA